MNLFLKKKQFNISGIVSVIAFFSLTAFLFNLYAINYSSLILIGIFAIYIKCFHKRRHMPSFFDLLILVALAILIVVVTTITFGLSPYCVSAIGFVILITMLFGDLHLSLIFSLIISILTASVEHGAFGLEVGVSLFCASLVAGMLSYRARTRSHIIRAGFLAGFVQFLVAHISERMDVLPLFSLYDLDLLKICLFNGIISAAVVIGFLPLFEYLFRVVTNISLLELSDFNNPLLKKMILEAPGTYQHSLVVANLAESATESIGANPLLARVGAYYHDIGKIPKAHYFVENQIPYRDVHKGLKPSISKMIIMKHVKEGIEMAKKFHINPRIIDFIAQHHGKSLVYYFYQRARELESENEREEEYRYPGPRAQSKETAIVALADTIEALSRTLEEPTPARIEEMIQNVVKRKFIEGELDESDLTLKDLEKIQKSFTRILNAIFHTRINYPQNGTDKKSSKS